MIIHHIVLYLMAIPLISAYDDLSEQKHATQSTVFQGTNDLYKAGNAVDRNAATCMRTSQIGPTSPDNTVWWEVDLGGVFTIYSVNILFKNYDGNERRQRGRFAGFSLYISNDGQNESLCYKDGPMLPPLDINITCNTAGRYVRFHNERRPGVTYPSGYELTTVFTELCEVIVYGCYRDGVYGSDCNKPCPINCKTNTCHIQDGHCFECKPGWTEATCNTDCAFGLYGVDCKQECPQHCRHNDSCDHLTGLCKDGCAPGWNGSYCNKTCDVGWYGPGCKQRCSGHCKDNTFCDPVNGYCNRGCVAGWYGPFCNKGCVQSFGEDCRYPCSTYCVNRTCDRFTGYCVCTYEEGSNDRAVCHVAGTNNETKILCLRNPKSARMCNYFSDFIDIDLGTHSTFWSYGGPISVGINLILIISAFIGIWAVYSKRMFVSFKQQSSARSDLYTEAEVIPEDHSHYQELGVSEGETPYQNTSLNH